MNAPPAELVAALRALAPAYGFGRVPLGLFLAQSALETGYWSSDVFRHGNNAFGLRRARVRPTPAVGIYAGHAQYLSLTDSVKDYLDRQRAFRIPDTSSAEVYVEATVASGYATATRYGSSWLSLYADRFASFAATNPTVLPLVAAGLGLWLAWRYFAA